MSAQEIDIAGVGWRMRGLYEYVALLCLLLIEFLQDSRWEDTT